MSQCSVDPVQFTPLNVSQKPFDDPGILTPLGKEYSKIKTIGEGGYSFVIEVKNKHGEHYALKCVRLQLEEQVEVIGGGG